MVTNGHGGNGHGGRPGFEHTVGRHRSRAPWCGRCEDACEEMGSRCVCGRGVHRRSRGTRLCAAALALIPSHAGATTTAARIGPGFCIGDPVPHQRRHLAPVRINMADHSGWLSARSLVVWWQRLVGGGPGCGGGVWRWRWYSRMAGAALTRTPYGGAPSGRVAALALYDYSRPSRPHTCAHHHPARTISQCDDCYHGHETCNDAHPMAQTTTMRTNDHPHVLGHSTTTLSHLPVW